MFDSQNTKTRKTCLYVFFCDKLTHDLPDSDHDPWDPDQTFRRLAKVRRGADAGPVDAAVEGELQTCSVWSKLE